MTDPTPEEMIRAAVRAGPWPASELRWLMEQAGVSERHFKTAMARVRAEGGVRLIQVRYYVAPSFVQDEAGSVLWVEGHSRAELIRRVSAHSPSASAYTTTTEDLMMGDDAGRLAAEAYGREVAAWR